MLDFHQNLENFYNIAEKWNLIKNQIIIIAGNYLENCLLEMDMFMIINLIGLIKIWKKYKKIA